MRKMPEKPEAWSTEEICGCLNTRFLGQHVYVLDEVDSTNSYALELAEQGAVEGTIVLAERQMAGRGRLGRTFASPPGGLYLSIVVRERLAARDVPFVTLLSGIAAARAIREVTGLPAQIKWPNDILVRGKKVCGILNESRFSGDKIDFIVIGIGMNVNTSLEAFPPEVQEVASTLKREMGTEVDRLSLLKALLGNVEELLEAYRSGEEQATIQQWVALSCTVGRRVSVRSQRGLVEGMALGIDRSGALVIETAGGKEERVVTGDVTLL